MTRVLFLTRSLNTGGAQRQLTELVRAIDKSRFHITVASFYPGGIFWEEIRGIPGVRIVSLEKRGRWDLFGVWRSALKLLKETRVDVVYGYREGGNLIALPLARVAGAKLIWGIRDSSKRLPSDLVALGMFGLSAIFSRWADCVIYNSVCGRDIYISRGYCSRNDAVIPNGFDTRRFRPDAMARERQRTAWGIGPREKLIGVIGRLNPVKDHNLFMESAASVSRTYRDVRFVVIGGGNDDYKNSLQCRAQELGIVDRVLWAGENNEMVRVYNALDIVSLCSKEEGCPNVVGEAMSCGVPCVVTDVGDAALMVGSIGLVVPPGNPEAMAVAWGKLLDLPIDDLHQMGIAARKRVIREYGLEIMVERTSSLFESMVQP